MVDATFKQWPFFAEDHRKLVSEIDDWARENIDDLIKNEHTDLNGTCISIARALGEAGWNRYAVPAGVGGVLEKLDVRSLCLIREVLSRHHVLADFVFAIQGLGSGPISLYGSAEQQERYLPKVASGNSIPAFALSEAEAGSDVAAMTTTAEQSGDDYILNGDKTWISNGGIADFYTVFARTGDAPGAKGLSCFIVDSGTPGFEVSHTIDTMSPHPLASLAFRDCKVPIENRVGESGRGFSIAMGTLDIFRTTVGAAALGFARRALDETRSHVSSRKLFGGTLSDLQLVQGKLADMAVQVDASALMVYRSAWTKDCIAERVTREAAMAKYYATEAAQQVIDAAVQLHGGLGVTRGHIIESLYRDIRALRIYEGASEIQQTIIARQLLSGD